MFIESLDTGRKFGYTSTKGWLEVLEMSEPAGVRTYRFNGERIQFRQFTDSKPLSREEVLEHIDEEVKRRNGH